ncbi:MAG: ribose-phosphate diphosphokinase [Candidatus Thermoplasmatota archaeon]|jgi:ribose-phosphate pyrophosphokinase|nr:ribose-phosphate diphosphokinase [Candidatus Thermoplasmatota archaeon]MCL5794006.1 ribose-phosphate diphosphokinase [Candidatus Thermoplasmatota archaeon]
MFLLPASSCNELCENLAKRLNLRLAGIERKRFPDGEMYIRIEEDLGGSDVMIVGNSRSDEEVVDSILLHEAARGMAPRSLVSLVPYFGYARQHMRYLPGEPISMQGIGQSYLRYSDRAFVIDIHDESALLVFGGKLSNIHIRSSFINYYRDRNISYVVSPDDGALWRAREVASGLGCDVFNFEKKRIDAWKVRMEPIDTDLKGGNVLLLDDIISTGGTIISAIELLKTMKAGKIYVSAVHGLLINGAAEKISQASGEIAVTNTIKSKYSKIDISEEVSKYIKEALKWEWN